MEMMLLAQRQEYVNNESLMAGVQKKNVKVDWGGPGGVAEPVLCSGVPNGFFFRAVDLDNMRSR